jgi:hypothetical protein
MLAIDPSLVRPRLELGRALFLGKQYSAARYHFEQVLAAPLPEQVRSNVLNFLTLIRERLPSFYFSFDIVSDSNPKQATSTEVVEIGGLPFRLNTDALAQDALGVAFTGQAKVPLPADSSWFVRGYLEHYDYEGSDLDQTYGLILAGKHLRVGRNELSFEGGWHGSNYQKASLYHGPAWRISDFLRVARAVGLTLSADARKLDYPTLQFLDGWQRSASAEVRYALDPRRTLVGGILYLDRSAVESAYAFSGGGFHGRYLHEWKKGWIGSLYYQYARYEFDGVDPLFGEQRSEYENRAEVSILNRYLSYRGVSPRLTVGSADRRSNIDLYDYRRHYIRAGVITEF